MIDACPPIVLDTNVLVAGACRRESSAAYRVLIAVLQSHIPLILTEGIIAEYENVLSRPAIRRLTGLGVREANDLILELISLSQRTQLRFSWRPNLRDEHDNKFVDAAISAGAVIITYNIRDFAGADLRKHGWDAMTPVEFSTRFGLEDG
jgi:putative PIN family toxin of toxin-antitoxin system